MMTRLGRTVTRSVVSVLQLPASVAAAAGVFVLLSAAAGSVVHATPAMASCVTGTAPLATVTGTIVSEDVVDPKVDTLMRFYTLSAEPSGRPVVLSLFGRAPGRAVEDAYPGPLPEVGVRYEITGVETNDGSSIRLDGCSGGTIRRLAPQATATTATATPTTAAATANDPAAATAAPKLTATTRGASLTGALIVAALAAVGAAAVAAGLTRWARRRRARR